MVQWSPIPKKWSQFTRANIERIPAQPGRFEILLAPGDIIHDRGYPDVRVKLLVALRTYPKAKGFRVEQ